MTVGLFRSGAVYGLGNVLSAAVPFLLLPVLTRALNPQEYGEVVAFYMLVTVSAAFAGLGLHSAVAVRWLDVSKDDPRRHTATAIAVTIASTLLTCALAAAVAPRFLDSLSPFVAALAPVVAGGLVLQGMRFAIWQARGRPVPAASLQVASALLNVMLSLTGVFVLHLGANGRIAGAALCALLISALSIHLMLRDGSAAGKPSAHDARALLRFGIPLVPHAVSGALLASADRFAVADQLGASALGVYGAASQLGLVINVLADASVKAYSPTMYRWLSTGLPRGRLKVVGVAYLSIPLWCGVALLLWAAFLAIGSLLLGDQYTSALNLSLWFLLGGAMSAIYLNVAGLFFFTGKTEWISLGSVAASLLALLVATPAVAAWGARGGALTYLLAQAALLAAAWVLSTRVQPMPWCRPRLALRSLQRERRARK
jgi:O-antigen/teichoic acid export membrane protein